MTMLTLVSPYVFLFLIRPEYFAELLRESATGLSKPARPSCIREIFARDWMKRCHESRNRTPCPRSNVWWAGNSVDVFGYEQAIALLNDLAPCRPDPCFKGTPRHAVSGRLNWRLLSWAHGSCVCDSQVSDRYDRFAAEDDAGALEVILRDYEPSPWRRGICCGSGRR